jgi:transcription elongation factor Elf1
MRVLSTLSDVIKLPIPCPNCGKEFMETVGRMKRQRKATCGYCDTRVDLSSEQWRSYIDTFAEACDRLQGPYRKLG